MLRRRLRYWFRRREREAALRVEMEAHIEEMRAEGVSEAEARRRFGRMAEQQERSREVWIARWVSDFWQDTRFGVRTIRKQPGFAAVAIASAALGIAACAMVFSMVNFALLRPLPVAEPERLMSLTGMHPENGIAGDFLSYPEIRDVREAAKSWRSVAAFAPVVPAGIRTGGGAQRYWGFVVTGNYFDVVRPGFTLGRGFEAGVDEIRGGPAKVVLSHALWRNAFGGDAGIVGRTITLNGRAFTVVGVTREGFRGTMVGLAADFYLPLSQSGEVDRVREASRMESYHAQWLMGVARLRDGVNLEQARAELAVISRAIRARAPDLTRTLYAEPASLLGQGARVSANTAFVLLMTLTGLVLMTACANVANLMLARATVRRGEIAMRMALGAGRVRLIRQLLAENLVLALAGGVLGAGLAEAATRLIANMPTPLPIPVDLAMPMDHRVLAFCAALSVVTALVFGLAPALRATRPDGGNMASLRRFGLRNLLVAGQVAVSTVLLVCSGLFLRSLSRMHGIDSGMDTRGVALVQFDPSLSHYSRERTQRLIQDVLRETEAIPGVQAAGVADAVPLAAGGNFTEVRTGGGAGQHAAAMEVSAGYFETLGIRVVAGSGFGRGPSAERVVMVNRELARKLYPEGDAIGQRLQVAGAGARVIGIVGNTKQTALDEAETMPIVYSPVLDRATPKPRSGGLTLLVKTAGNVAPISGEARRRVQSLDPALVVSEAGTMEEQVEESLFVPRLAAVLAGLCGAMGLAIASVGVYGVISFAVARRRREIGIRMAVGARAGQVVRMVLAHGAGVTLVGVVVGLGLGLGLARVASSLLYGVSTSDPVTFGVVALLMAAVALTATAIPARRAAMVEPNETLRAE